MSFSLQFKSSMKLFSGLLLLAGISLNSFAASAGCPNNNCLHVYSNTINSRTFNQGYTRLTVLVKVVDQDNTIAGAMGAVVHGLWTRPDGSSLEQYANITRRGRANFRHYSSNLFGQFTFQVLDVNKPDYGFDPSAGAPLTVSYNLQNPDNTAPIALINTDATQGTAPLSISFSGSSSSDADGNIVSYHWDFGDGNSSEQAEASHTFSQPGNYQVVLTVIDNQGAEDHKTVSITVAPSAGSCSSNCLHINNINMSVYRPRWGINSSRVTAKVRVLNQMNQSIQGVTVNATWTLPDGSQVEQSHYIDPASWKYFADLKVPAVQTGTYQLHISNVIADGYNFDTNASTTSASISVSP